VIEPESDHEICFRQEAIALIPKGGSIMVGGFMGIDTPERLLNELVRQRNGCFAAGRAFDW
jgi:acyl CoA:acetate/3-ketoacid CoA transferase alpha subunit